MIERYTQFLIHRPVAVATVHAALVASGLFALERLPVDLTPAVDLPALSIQTAWPGVAAETVEMILTSPIEETAHTIPGIRRVSSVSSEGLSRVHAEFEQKTNMDFARLELYEKLAALVRTLPPGIGSPALDPYVPEDLRNLHGFMSYSLVGTQSASVLRNLGQGEIALRLRSIRGVADVVVLGGEEEEVHIELDAQKILSLGLRVEEVDGRAQHAGVQCAGRGVLTEVNPRDCLRPDSGSHAGQAQAGTHNTHVKRLAGSAWRHRHGEPDNRRKEGIVQDQRKGQRDNSDRQRSVSEYAEACRRSLCPH